MRFGDKRRAKRDRQVMSERLPEHAEEFRSDLLAWATQNLREYPWRESDRSLYEVFVAEFMLTQTPADNVDRVYPTFLQQFPDIESLDEADLQEIETAIESDGFPRMLSQAP